MRITRANMESIKYACTNFHYAKRTPANPIGYNVYNNSDEWCGVIVYGTGANNKIGSEYNLCQGQILELTRVALNGKQEQTSKALALTISQIRKDIPQCRMLVSYADIDQNHLGIIYQATNWIYTGDSLIDSHDSSYIVRGKRLHGRALSSIIKSKGGLKGMTRDQFVQYYLDANAERYITKGKRKYVFALDKKMRKKLLSLSKPYPKNLSDNREHSTQLNNEEATQKDESRENRAT